MKLNLINTAIVFETWIMFYQFYLYAENVKISTELPKNLLFNSNRNDLKSNNLAEKLFTFTIPAVNVITRKVFVKSPEISSAYNDTNFQDVGDALKNIAYYLRAHKFNEYDRRYEKNSALASRTFYATFPRPPLRSLHWEVHKHCEQSFETCIKYLNRIVKQTGLKRADDTAVVIEEQKWNFNQHSKQIDTVESECRKMLETDDIVADPFQGPIERFQWRTSASYYMCWFTMNEIPQLKHFSDSCDNFANCLDPTFGVHNNDPRANDNIAFACARYSFCADSCCPIKHIKSFNECWDDVSNPCFAVSNSYERDCFVNRSQNTDFKDVVLNRWNVSCTCPHVGYEWDSKYGMCLDKDECLDELHGCDPEREACVNLLGSFRCACRWGYRWDLNSKRCEPIKALEIIELHKMKDENEEANRNASSIVKALFNRLFVRNSSRNKTIACNLIPVSLVLLLKHMYL